MDYNLFTDSHIHVGQFNDKYFDPLKTASFLLETIGIGRIAVSSTSAGDPVYDTQKLLYEIAPIIDIYKERIIHLFWVNPESPPDKKFWAELQIPIHGLKIHQNMLNWSGSPEALERFFIIAEEKKLPLLIHTGYDPNCSAGSYKSIITKHPTVRVILAHGRPGNEALSVLEECPNAWIDTSFMPMEDIELMVNKGMENRMLFGSDYPITTIFEEGEIDHESHYLSILDNISKKFGKELLLKWANVNPGLFWR